MSVCWRVLGVEGSQKLNIVDQKFYASPNPQTKMLNTYWLMKMQINGQCLYILFSTAAKIFWQSILPASN